MSDERTLDKISRLLMMALVKHKPYLKDVLTNKEYADLKYFLAYYNVDEQPYFKRLLQLSQEYSEITQSQLFSELTRLASQLEIKEVKETLGKYISYFEELISEEEE